jgi:hypothetical protein
MSRGGRRSEFEDARTAAELTADPLAIAAMDRLVDVATSLEDGTDVEDLVRGAVMLLTVLAGWQARLVAVVLQAGARRRPAAAAPAPPPATDRVLSAKSAAAATGWKPGKARSSTSGRIRP